MTTVRVKIGEVIAPIGQLEVGRLVIDPATSLVVGRLLSINHAEGTVDVAISEARVGELMTQLRGAKLSDSGAIMSEDICRIATGGSLWHAHHVDRKNAGHVGTHHSPLSAYYELLKIDSSAAEAVVVAQFDNTQESFPIHVRWSSHRIRYEATILDLWRDITVDGLNVIDAIASLRRKLPNWRLGDAIPDDETTAPYIIPHACKILVSSTSPGYSARWGRTMPHGRGDPIQVENCPSLETAVARLMENTTVYGGAYLNNTRPEWRVRNAQGDPFAVGASPIAGGWTFQIRHFEQPNRDRSEVINQTDLTAAIRSLRQRYDKYDFADTIVTDSDPPRSRSREQWRHNNRSAYPDLSSFINPSGSIPYISPSGSYSAPMRPNPPPVEVPPAPLKVKQAAPGRSRSSRAVDV